MIQKTPVADEFDFIRNSLQEIKVTAKKVVADAAKPIGTCYTCKRDNKPCDDSCHAYYDC
jgi:hypothetical protein